MEAREMQVLPLCWCQWEEDKEMLAAVGPWTESRGRCGIKGKSGPCTAKGYLGLEKPMQIRVWTELEIQGHTLGE